MSRNASLRIALATVIIGAASTSAFAMTDQFISNTVMRMQEQNSTATPTPTRVWTTGAYAARYNRGFDGDSMRANINREDQFSR